MCVGEAKSPAWTVLLTRLTILLMTTTTQSLRQHLLRGGRSYGPLLLGDSPIVAELLSLVGYDHLVIDHEHGTTDIRSGLAMLQAMDAAQAHFHDDSSATPPRRRTRTEAIVRVPAPHDPVYMKKVLDTLRLPAGVLVPMVDTAEMAEQVVRSTRYPTGNGTANKGSLNGNRGCAAPLVRGSGWGMAPHDYEKQSRDDLLVMIQVETPQAIQAVPEMAQIEGIDGIFIGPLDLSANIGKMGQFQDGDVQALILRAEEAVRNSPAFLAGFRPPGRDLGEMFDAGFQFVCGSVDLALLREAAKADWVAAQKHL